MFSHTLRALFAEDSHLRRIYEGTVWPMLTFNYGPEFGTVAQMKINPAADGADWIMVGGNYDPKLGGHIIIWALGLIIELPPGSSIILASVLEHASIGVRRSEKYFTVTQYAPGGLFRWVRNGFVTWDTLKERDPDRADRYHKAHRTRGPNAVALFSKYSELAADRLDAFGM